MFNKTFALKNSVFLLIIIIKRLVKVLKLIQKSAYAFFSNNTSNTQDLNIQTTFTHKKTESKHNKTKMIPYAK